MYGISLLSHGLSNPAKTDRCRQLSNLTVISSSHNFTWRHQLTSIDDIIKTDAAIIIITTVAIIITSPSSLYHHHHLKWAIYWGAKARVAGGHYRRRRQPSHLLFKINIVSQLLFKINLLTLPPLRVKINLFRCYVCSHFNICEESVQSGKCVRTNSDWLKLEKAVWICMPESFKSIDLDCNDKHACCKGFCLHPNLCASLRTNLLYSSPTSLVPP